LRLGALARLAIGLAVGRSRRACAFGNMGPVGLHGLAARGALARGDDLDDAIALEPLDPDQPLAFEPLHHDRPHRARIVATQHLDIDVAGAGLAVARGLFQRAVGGAFGPGQPGEVHAGRYTGRQRTGFQGTRHRIANRSSAGLPICREGRQPAQGGEQVPAGVDLWIKEKSYIPSQDAADVAAFFLNRDSKKEKYRICQGKFLLPSRGFPCARRPALPPFQGSLSGLNCLLAGPGSAPRCPMAAPTVSAMPGTRPPPCWPGAPGRSGRLRAQGRTGAGSPRSCRSRVWMWCGFQAIVTKISAMMTHCPSTCRHFAQ
jgi:hypothetical protein